MALSFTTQMVRIGELFADSAAFDMPDFQRPFCWDEETAAQLFDDIHAAMVRGQPENGRRRNRQDYFLGPIIITRRHMNEPAEVIDGQQRLVTLTTLLALLRDALSAQSSRAEELQELIVRPERNLRHLPGRPRVLLREADRAYLLDWVQTLNGTDSLPSTCESESGVRILDAVRRLKSDLGTCNEGYLQRLADFVVNNCYVIQIRARDLDDGYVLFKSLNSRGEPLSELDLAKAELLGASPPPPGLDLQTLARQWEHAQTRLNRDVFEDYMKSVLSLIATRPQDRDLRDLMKEVLRNPISANNFRIMLGHVLRHAASLEDAALDFGPSSEAINRTVECLMADDRSAWRSVALPWLALNPAGNTTLKFFRALDSLCLGMTILGKTPRQKLQRLKNAAREVVNLREAAVDHAGALYFTSREHEQLIAILASPISTRKRLLKPLLLRLNAKMQDQMIPFYLPTAATIEHVLPQRPAPGSPWLVKYPDAAQRRICTELLGNYALLTRPMNASAGNLDFVDKRAKMFGRTNGQTFPITANLVNYASFDAIELRDRHAKLVGLALELLGLPPIVAMPQAAE